MVKIIILAAAVLAFLGLCGAMAVTANKRAVEADESAQRALNTAEKTIENVLGRIRTQEIAFRALSSRLDDLKGENAALQDEIVKIRALIPEDIKEERLRRDVLMSQLNDELENRVRAEQEWNSMVAGILGYDLNKAKAAGVKNDE